MRSRLRRVVGILVLGWLVLIVLSLIGGVGWPELLIIAVLTALALWWSLRGVGDGPD